MIKAKYTIVLETLLSDDRVKPLIDDALSTYPMYTPENPANYSIIPTRESLNSKILNHYKYREIGFETIGRFVDELKIAMEEIMPYYYQLFKSADIMNGIEDPFGNVDIVESFEEERTGKSIGSASDNVQGSSSSNNTSNTSSTATDNVTTTESMSSDGKSVKADTPQGLLDITAKNIDSIPYATEVNWNNNNSNSEGSSSGTNTTSSETSSQATSENTSESSSESSSESEGMTKHTLSRKGNHGVNTYAHDMKELRETFLNIERQIINDDRIQELFMLVY